MRFQQLSYQINGPREVRVPTHLTHSDSATKDELMRYFRLIYDETQDDVLWSTGGHGLVSNARMEQDGSNEYIKITFISGTSMWDLTNHQLTIAMDYGESPHDILTAINNIDTYVELTDDEMESIFTDTNNG